jgi:hypothetical protein
MPALSASAALAVGYPNNRAASVSVIPGLCVAVFGYPYDPEPAASCLVAVGHPEKSLSDVRRADARSAQIGGPDFIAQCFQVSAYSGEPFTSSVARNLFSKDDWRAALGDEPSHLGPQVSLVVGAPSLARSAERLAWTRACPNRPVVGPSGESQGVGPAADTGEQVDGLVWCKVIGCQLRDGTCVDGGFGDVALTRKLAEPGSGLGVVLVQVHFPTPVSSSNRLTVA